MKGKVLGLGVISGDDGKRYSFEVSDIKNLKDRNPESLENCEVDFEAIEGMAKEIFIIQSNNSIDIGNIKNKIIAGDVQGIRLKLLVAIGLSVTGAILGLIPVVGWFFNFLFGVVALTLWIMAVVALKRASNSQTLLRNFLISLFIGIVSFVIAIFSEAALMAVMLGTSGFIGSILGVALMAAMLESSGGIVAIIILVAGVIGELVFGFFFIREFSFIIQQKYILWSFYISIVATIIVAIPFVGWVIAILMYISALVLAVLAILHFNAIRKRETGDSMPFF